MDPGDGDTRDIGQVVTKHSCLLRGKEFYRIITQQGITTKEQVKFGFQLFIML
jgi:hypothetical protein